jgi:hypothetical protein
MPDGFLFIEDRHDERDQRAIRCLRVEVEFKALNHAARPAR